MIVKTLEGDASGRHLLVCGTVLDDLGFGESLKLSARWGLSPKALQIRLTLDWHIPVARAIE